MPEEQQNVVPQNKKKFYLIGLAISFGVCSLLFGLILIIEFFGLNMNMKDDGYLIMIDASTISGLMMLLFWLLVIITNEGAFDLISYSIKLVWYTTFHKSLRNVKLARTYADYRLEKRSKGKTNTSFIALGGAPYLIAGLILLIPYYAFR
jgi:hypothetical protein